MTVKLSGFHRKLYQTRYARKAKDKLAHIKVGSSVITLVKDGKYPVRETATVDAFDGKNVEMTLTSGMDAGTKFTQRIELVDVLIEEEYEETAERVANHIASVEKPEIRKDIASQFKEVIANFDLVPSGRILAGAGDDAEVTLFNCYVTNILPAPYAMDKGADSRQAIFYHEQRIAEIMAHGGGNGTCLSVLRPRYTRLSTTKGESAGAVFTGNRFSSLTQWVNQGNRRGAQMLTIHDWAPDVYYTNDPDSPDYSQDFIGAKTVPGFMEGNNSSVLISDAFMKAVEEDANWDLIFPDTTHPAYNAEWNGSMIQWKEKGYPVIVYNTVKARDMWNKLVKCNWLSAEPGIIFIDEVLRMHPLWYLGEIMATNPCGEQPLLNGSTCNLSAINWGRMIKEVGQDEHGAIYEIDWVKFGKTIAIAQRFLDNVIDATHYFDPSLQEWQQGERRVGLGLLGLADLLIALRIPYGSKESLEVVEQMIKFQRNVGYMTSVELAIEKGSFPFYDKEKYAQGGFFKTLPDEIQWAINTFGIRNGTNMTIAPTGTTGSITPSLLDPMGSVSTGCEPHFAMKYHRLSRIGSTIQYAGVAQAYMNEHPDAELPEWFVGAMDLSPEDHVAMQAVLQKYIDTSISKTVNCPASYTEQDVAEVYVLAHKMGLKGTTIYRDGSRDEQILSNIDTENEAPEAQEIEVKETKVKGKYDDWQCGSCGSKKFTMVENCPQCDDCGMQACSIG
jgi:ribonucleoside-diphosphate reductase alpha chain